MDVLILVYACAPRNAWILHYPGEKSIQYLNIKKCLNSEIDKNHFKKPSERQNNRGRSTSRLRRADRKFENTFCLGAHRIESISHVVGVHTTTTYHTRIVHGVSKTGCRIFIYNMMHINKHSSIHCFYKHLCIYYKTKTFPLHKYIYILYTEVYVYRLCIIEFVYIFSCHIFPMNFINLFI